MLDTTPLGLLARRRAAQVDLSRLANLLNDGARVYLPEIADYEVRRSFLLHDLHDSLRELDRLKRQLDYAPLTTVIMGRAASFWAAARRRGTPTADRHALDGDVILASQAIEMGATVLTENVGHFGQFVPTLRWQDVSV